MQIGENSIHPDPLLNNTIARLPQEKKEQAGEDTDRDRFIPTLKREMPSNLVLDGYKPATNKVWAVINEGMFQAFALACLGGCAITAVIPNLINRFKRGHFTDEQIKEIKKELQPGDIILTQSAHHQTFHFYLKAGFGHDYSHAAFYAGDNTIIDSYNRVASQSVDNFCKHFTDMIILRPDYKSEDDKKRGIQYAYKQVGKKYDVWFNTITDKTHYCSELVLRALDKAKAPIKVKGHVIFKHPFVLPDDFLNVSGITPVKEFNAD